MKTKLNEEIVNFHKENVLEAGQRINPETHSMEEALSMQVGEAKGLLSYLNNAVDTLAQCEKDGHQLRDGMLDYYLQAFSDAAKDLRRTAELVERENSRRWARVVIYPRATRGLEEQVAEIQALLPGNYHVIAVADGDWARHTAAELQEDLDDEIIDPVDERGITVYLTGVDNAGWTLDAYVIPRLGSAMYGAEEIDDEESIPEVREQDSGPDPDRERFHTCG